MAPDSSRALEAFIHFFSTFSLSRPVFNLSDLGDGAAIYDVLSIVDSGYFGHSASPPLDLSNEWVDRLTSLKRVYRLMMQYFSEVLQQPTGRLDVPDLQAIAKDFSEKDILILSKLSIAAAVQSERKKDVIERIRRLSDDDQHHLMRAIEQVMSKMNQQENVRNRVNSMTEDDHYYQLQSERSRISREKDALQQSYEALMHEHQAMRVSRDDAKAEKEDILARLKDARRELDDKRNERADAFMRAEIDRLRIDLQKSEDNLALAEVEIERHTTSTRDLTRQVEDLQIKADEASKLKDQLDEYRHVADKLQKSENVMEKYKKKLEESADMRRRIRSLEEQNASLVDKNASLEEEYRKVSAYKPLIDSYKSQVAELEGKVAARSKELDTVKFDLEQSKTRLRIVSEEREKDSETLELYQERIRELELLAPKLGSQTSPKQADGPAGNMTEMTVAELYDPDADIGPSGELEDALSGTTSTDLKLQIRKLKRDLEAAHTNQADASRILVLENLLEDANRMKSRYEQDYLATHRDKLRLQKNLEDIRNGKTGDSAEAAIALRQRLNETVDELDALKKEHAELSVRYEGQSNELTVARSDLNLVNKDQLDILASLRESVNADKVDLQNDVDRMRNAIKELTHKNKMQLEQINTLLIEKVNMQTEDIGHREKMLERERNFSDLRASIAGKDLPEDVKNRLLHLHEENVSLKEQIKSVNEKLTKAKAFIKNQDQLFKAEAAAKSLTASPAAMEELEANHRSQMKALEDENARLRDIQRDMKANYAREQMLTWSLLHQNGMKTMQDHVTGQVRPQPSSWLRRQRQAVERTVRRS